MTIQVNAEAQIVCTMSVLEFVGIFRTIADSSQAEREANPGIRLTTAENISVSQAFTVAGSHEILGPHIMAERD